MPKPWVTDNNKDNKRPMAILKIARMGHPVLGMVADTVTDCDDPAIKTLVSDMVDTLVDIGGAGLAAPQVHESKRIIIYHVPESRAGENEMVALRAFINPVLTPIGDETGVAVEGCLSLPGMAGAVERYLDIHYKATLLNGDSIEGEAHGFHARVLQHECDHLDGTLYPERMQDLSSFGFVEELSKREQ